MYQDFPSRIFCLTVPKKSRGESFTVALISGMEKVRMREGGVSRISVENFLSHSADIFQSGDPFSVSLISGIEKFYAPEGYVTIFDFLLKFFCLTVPNDFVGEPFSVSLISGTERIWIKGGGLSRFSVEFFLCYSAKKIQGGILYCCINFGNGKN